MKTYLSLIASLLFVVLGCIQTLWGEVASGCQGLAPPAPKTYTIAVTGTAYGTSQSVQMQVTVQQ